MLSLENIMAPQINLTIDRKPVTVPVGSTILQAAEQLGEAIPTICYHEACTSNGLCRLCVVEVEGSRLLQAACLAQVSPGMVVHTRSERVERARRTILELLTSSVDLSESARIQAYLHEYAVDPNPFPGTAQRKPPLLDDNPMFIRDYAQCVLCWRCVQVCAEDAQYTFALTFQGRGFDTQICTFYDQPLPETTCVFCGQCLGVCPTGALKPKREWLLEQGVSLQETMVITGSKE
jgi:NADH dehydrogenase/NADH:ubiquinone oxidoreductase subunit G